MQIILFTICSASFDEAEFLRVERRIRLSSVYLDISKRTREAKLLALLTIENIKVNLTENLTMARFQFWIYV